MGQHSENIATNGNTVGESGRENSLPAGRQARAIGDLRMAVGHSIDARCRSSLRLLLDDNL